MQIGFQTWDKEGVSFKFARFGVHQGGFIIFRLVFFLGKFCILTIRKPNSNCTTTFFFGKKYYKSCLRKVGV